MTYTYDTPVAAENVSGQLTDTLISFVDPTSFGSVFELFIISIVAVILIVLVRRFLQ